MQKSTFTLIVATSLDGYIARTSHTNSHMDWTSKEDWEFFQSKLAHMDALIVWRHTFCIAESRLRKRKTYVLTHAQEEIIKDGSVTWINPDISDIGEVLAQGNHKNIAILWGKNVYSWAIEYGYCNELFLTIEPIILGSGVRFLDTLSEHKLRLESSSILNNRWSILLHYILTWSSHR